MAKLSAGLEVVHPIDSQDLLIAPKTGGCEYIIDSDSSLLEAIIDRVMVRVLTIFVRTFVCNEWINGKASLC